MNFYWLIYSECFPDQTLNTKYIADCARYKAIIFKACQLDGIF